MAKITDATTLDGIWFGSKWNEKRSILALPAGGADEPGLLFLEAVDSSADLQDGLYLWASSDDKLHVHTSRPTDEDGDGFVLDSTTIGAAPNKALSNLASVAVNTDIVSDTDSTDDLGSSSIYWAEGYFDKLYLNSTATLSGSSAGSATLVGNLVGGVSGTGSAFQFFATTAGGYLNWDDTANSNAGGLIFTDDAQAIFGDSSDFTMQWNAAAMVLDNKTANTGNLLIGSAVATDVQFHGTTGGSDLIWDSSGDVLYASDDTHIAFGDGIDMYLNFDAADLELRQTTPGTGGLNIGVNDAGIDITIFGDTTALGVQWDTSENELVFYDTTKLVFGGTTDTGADDLIIASDGTVVNLTFGATTNGIVAQAYTAQTVSVLDIDGDTADWDGADNVGMLHIRQDAPLIHKGASLFYIDNSGKPITAAEGFMARLMDTSSNTASTYAVEMYSTANHILHMHTGAVAVVPLTIAPHTNATASAISVDAGTDGFVGAANTGLVNISAKGTLAQTTASCLRIDSNGTYATNGEGGCLFIDDDMTAATTNYSVYVNSNAVNCMKLETAATTMTALTLESATNATAAAFVVDGDANGFLGATGVGLVTVKNDIALAHTLSSTMLIDVGTTKPIDAAEGYCLRIADTSLVATSNNAYTAYIDATANHGMKIETRATAATNLTLSGVQAQTVPLMIIDADTGTGWDGADDTGALTISSDSILVANGATLLRVDSSAQQKSGSEGALARFENTGAAQANAVMVEIVAKDATEYALNVGQGMVKVTDQIYAGGYHHNVTDVTATNAGLQLTGKTGFYTYDETTGDNGDILLLPAAVVGMEMWLQNIDASHDVVLTPTATEQINALGAGTGTTVGEGVLTHVVCSVTGHWRANNYAAAGTITACT